MNTESYLFSIITYIIFIIFSNSITFFFGIKHFIKKLETDIGLDKITIVPEEDRTYLILKQHKTFYIDDAEGNVVKYDNNSDEKRYIIVIEKDDKPKEYNGAVKVPDNQIEIVKD